MEQNDKLKMELLETLDRETNKDAKDINTEKVETIVNLLDLIDMEPKKAKGDSVEKFIKKFNKAHRTNLVANMCEFKMNKQTDCMKGLLGSFVAISVLNVVIFINLLWKRSYEK